MPIKCKKMHFHNELSFGKDSLKKLREMLDVSKPFISKKKALVKSKDMDRMSYKDAPVFQVSRSTIWHPSKDVLESPTHFTRTFGMVLTEAGCNIDKAWEKWLLQALHKDYDAWFEKELKRKKFTWKRPKNIFLHHFVSTDRLIAKATEVYTMTIPPSESVHDYGT